MSDLFREVDEAMRVDHMKRLWEQHGNTVIVLIAAIILGTAFNSGWNTYKVHTATKQTSALIEAFKDEDPSEKLDGLTKELKGAGKAFAAIDAGSLALENQDIDKSLSYYEVVAKDKSAPQDLRDLATLQMVSIQLDHKTDISGDDLLASLAPLISSEKSAWKDRAVFLSAIIKAHKKMDYKAALEDLALLSADKNLPPSLTAQVEALQDVYTYNLSHAVKTEEKQ